MKCIVKVTKIITKIVEIFPVGFQQNPQFSKGFLAICKHTPASFCVDKA